MDFARQLGRRIAEKIAATVARNELFEKPGDRVSEPSLPDDAWSPPVSGEGETDDEDPDDGDADDPRECRAADLDTIAAALNGSQTPTIVIHWATWCTSCVDELPALVTLHERIGEQVEFIGISWDAFMGNQDAVSATAEVRGFVNEHSLNWKQLLVDAAPDDFFGRFDMQCREVPQTWLVGADGVVLHRIEGPVDAAVVTDLERRVEAL